MNSDKKVKYIIVKVLFEITRINKSKETIDANIWTYGIS